MKKLMTLTLILGLMMFSMIGVRAESMEIRSVEAIIAEIRMDQGITNTDPIDISKVTSAKLEELGDAVMEEYIGNHEFHERMDTALGGEGSIFLTNVHIRVGSDYLAGIPITMMTFMSAGGMMAYGGMMGRFGTYNQTGALPRYAGMMGGFGWIGMLLGLFVIIALIVGVVHLVSRSSRHSTIVLSDGALITLKERYARGEITRETYLEMVKDLK